MKKIISVLLVSALVVSAVVMSACQKQENTQNKNQTSSASAIESQNVSQQNSNAEPSEESVPEISLSSSTSRITASQISKLNQNISKYQEVPSFEAKLDTISAANIAGSKVISYIPNDSENSFTHLLTDQFKKAARAVGFKKVNIAETDGTASKISDAFTEAIKNKSDEIVMMGDISKDSFSSSIELAQANGIEVISSASSGLKLKDHYVDYSVAINYEFAGQLLADWTIVKNNGRVRALAVNNNDSLVSNSIYNGFGNEYKQYISSDLGYCTTLNASDIDAGNGLAAKIKDELQKDANINYIIVFDESMINDAVSAVQQLNKNSVKIVATGGSPEAFEMAQSGNIEMLVGQSYEWIAYATVDYALRVLNGSALPEDEQIPFRIVTASSIKKDLDADNSDSDGFYQICFGSAFVDGYNSVWGY